MAAMVSLGRRGPLEMVEGTISKLSQRHCNREQLPPSYIMGQSYAYLLTLFRLEDESAVIDMQNNCFCISGMKQACFYGYAK